MGRTWWRAPLMWGAILTGLLVWLAATGGEIAPIAHGGSTQGSSHVMAGMEMSAKATPAATHVVVKLHQRVVRVNITNFAFSPAHLVVSAGTRIIWTNKDGDPHTVDSVKGLWSSEALDTGDKFARVFKTAGTFTYYCSIHPFMQGSIIVKK